MVRERVIVVAHTDAEAIQKLKEIENSTLSSALLSLELQSICAMLSQEAVFDFLRGSECKAIGSLLPSVIDRIQ